MSDLIEATITCIGCGQVFPITYWGSVNATLDPHLKEEIFSGELRLRQCPSCGQKVELDTELLYHDMDRKLMILYQITADDRTPTLGSAFLTKLAASLPLYQLRIVSSWNQLKEKILIFDAGLNDSAVEILKIVAGDRAYGHADFADDSLYFLGVRSGSSAADELVFEAYQNGKLVAVVPVPMSLYQHMYASAAEQFGDDYGAGEWKIVNQGTMREGTS
jgi:hypothetical protein